MFQIKLNETVVILVRTSVLPIRRQYFNSKVHNYHTGLDDWSM